MPGRARGSGASRYCRAAAPGIADPAEWRRDIAGVDGNGDVNPDHDRDRHAIHDHYADGHEDLTSHGDA